MKVLVTGGAGYIGSFMTVALLEAGHEVAVLDSLERGHRDMIDSRAKFLAGNLLDTEFLDSVFSSTQFDAVIHFAAYISMGESMQEPYLYFQDNTYGALNLLNAMVQHDVKKIIFSSTAGVYGNPERIPIPEGHPKNPENPYGESKWMVEKILLWFGKIHGMRSVALRYFNAAGAALDGSRGEDHDPETHIIPCAIRAILDNSEFELYGTDYKTPDGTCVRDYIHVLDLVESHIEALNKIEKEEGNFAYNVGTGKGYSNKEVLDMVKKVSSKELKIANHDRRPGDADELVADATKIKSELGFSPQYSDLETIVETAWKWHQKNLESKIQNSK